MKTKKTYVAFFDIDNTLLTVNSGKIIVIASYKAGLISTGDYIKAIILSIIYKFRLQKTESTVNSMARLLKGKNAELIEKFSNQIINEQLIQMFRLSVLKEIEQHRKNGAVIVILSAAMSHICRPIANYLGIDDLICSEPEIIKGIFTGKSLRKLCYGKEKEVRAKQYCDERSYKLSDAYFYGDTDSDKHALAAVGYPVCVSPNKRLKRLAKLNAWKIMQ